MWPMLFIDKTMNKRILIATLSVITILLVIFNIARTDRAKEKSDLPLLMIDSSPRGAIIYISGIENPIITPASVFLDPNDYHFWGYLDGYFPVEKNIIITEKTKNIFFEFDKILGSVLEEGAPDPEGDIGIFELRNDEELE